MYKQRDEKLKVSLSARQISIAGYGDGVLSSILRAAELPGVFSLVRLG